MQESFSYWDFSYGVGAMGLGEEWALDYNSMTFWDFPDLS